jgi:hypothetical protein
MHHRAKMHGEYWGRYHKSAKLHAYDAIMDAIKFWIAANLLQATS